ncbi:MAG: NAD(P)H-dependent oxidoreductase subunit E [Candidatus Cloacimonadales bacterium]|nr:NAD(P)H-dependent oxidoreductase subunit E [Candidatus Cloacimonadota bacterium]MDD2651178.1 NAD(P)H-dependent oxidoreductase subunit E [Candidatus Cloacimonadota bacterium]MDD3502410.1 NAD(P)H-dependent oxidoreductase subunit E [Candidatus Cloacimonadota bacterium]MDX9976559.1 NAD(P)H-dependent oxidoreductase subunit E [Candidatus Cloacimonadales bacterium]
MIITVCVGSSCHIKGSHAFIDYLQKAISAYKMEQKIILKASFCMGHCSEGINIKVDDEHISVNNLDAMKELFTNRLVEEAERETCIPS